MDLFVGILQSLGILILIFISTVYLRQLTKIKKERKLLTFESSMFILIEIALLLMVSPIIISLFT